MNQSEHIFQLEMQVKNLLQALDEVTQQVTQCMYCGKTFEAQEHRERDNSTNYVMHSRCYISMLNEQVQEQERERLAERRNEEALYGYEIASYRLDPEISANSIPSDCELIPTEDEF